MNCPVCRAPAKISVINGVDVYHYACSVFHLVDTDRRAYEEVFTA